MDNAPPTPPTVSWGALVRWAGAFAVLTFVLVGMSESDDYGEVARAGAWLVALGATAYWWDSLNAGARELVGP